MTEIQTGVDQNPKILIRTEANLDQANKYNAGTVGKHVTLEDNAKVLRRRGTIEEVHDALLLVVDSPLDDWVLDSGASFHTTPH